MQYHVPFLESAAHVSNMEKNDLMLKFNELNAANAEQKKRNQELSKVIENESIKNAALNENLEAEREKNRILEMELQLQQMESFDTSANSLKQNSTLEDILEILEQDKCEKFREEPTQIDERPTNSNRMQEVNMMDASINAPQLHSMQLNDTPDMIQQKIQPLAGSFRHVIINPLTGLELETISSDEDGDEMAVVSYSDNSCSTFTNVSNQSDNHRSSNSNSSSSVISLATVSFSDNSCSTFSNVSNQSDNYHSSNSNSSSSVISFPCQNCSYVAKRKYALNIHQLQHCKATKNTKSKDKTCRMCQKKFTHDGLRSHLRGFIGAPNKNRQIKSAHKSFTIECHKAYLNEIKLR